MKIDQLFQFIVPLTFLAIWALTSLFNREAQPLPPRTGRPPDPNGPKPPGTPPTMRPLERRPDLPPREAPLRWSPPGAQPPDDRRPPARPDDIVILETETKRPSPPPAPRPVSGAPQRRAARVKPAPRRPEPAPPRALSGSGTTHLAPQLNRSMDVKPLTRPTSAPLTDVETAGASRSIPTRPASQDAPQPTDPRPLVVSPEKVRESIIMSEILRPPLALRPARRRGF